MRNTTMLQLGSSYKGGDGENGITYTRTYTHTKIHTNRHTKRHTHKENNSGLSPLVKGRVQAFPGQP